MYTMKTYMTFAACCGLLLGSGCVGQQQYSPEGPDAGGPRELHFGVSSLKTRGNAVLSVDEITSMGIFGYTTTEQIPNTAGAPVGGWAHPANLLNNQKVTRDVSVSPNVWEYDPQEFWPSDLTLNNSFFAYSPHSSLFAESSYAVASVPAAGGPPTLRYSLPGTIAEQKDILYAKPIYNVNVNSTDGVNQGKVEYHMEHALTWLAFVVAPTSALADGEDPRDFREAYSVNWLTFMADNMPLVSTLNLETGKWGEAEMSGDVQWDFLLDPAKSHNVIPGQTARLTDEGNRMMIFPFDIPRGMATVDLTFYYNKNGDSYNRATNTYTGDEYHYHLPIPETPMLPGIVVVYLINISIEGASIEFKGTNRIEDWLPGGTIGGPGKEIEMY